MQNEVFPIQATLMHLAAEGADSASIADTAVQTWRRVDEALSPIVGSRGVAALFKRSLHLTRPHHPWLAAAHDGMQPSGDFETLRMALSLQPCATTIAANGALLTTFVDLLNNLIGASLTERLLKSVSEQPSSGMTARDTLP